jgi:hypothetical protein
MAKVEINASRATHFHYGGQNAIWLLEMMRTGAGYGPWHRRMEKGYVEWLVWTEFPDDCVPGLRSTLKKIGVPDTAIKVRAKL